MISKKQLYLFCFITLFGFGAAGYILIYFFQDKNIFNILQGNFSFKYQLVLGIIEGLIISAVAIAIVQHRWMEPVRTFFSELIQSLRLTIPEVIFVSFCAAVGEELLFRGGLQPILGIWLTSLLFVAVHGYLNPNNYRISIYGIYMVLAIVLVGFLSVKIGLVSAISAHFTIDVVLLLYLAGRFPGLNISK